MFVAHFDAQPIIMSSDQHSVKKESSKSGEAKSQDGEAMRLDLN